MPGREPNRSELKRRALADLERARLSLALHTEEASVELSPASIVERSFKKHRATWLVGAAVAGAVVLRLVLSGSSKNERDISGKSGTKKGRLIRMLSVPLIAMGRKAAFDYATRYFKNHFKQPYQASATEQDPI
jgi:hypothetical protein